MQDILKRILENPNVHSIQVAEKRKSPDMAGEVAFRIFVYKKLPHQELLEGQKIPDHIYGMPTDVRQVKKQDQ